MLPPAAPVGIAQLAGAAEAALAEVVLAGHFAAVLAGEVALHLLRRVDDVLTVFGAGQVLCCEAALVGEPPLVRLVALVVRDGALPLRVVLFLTRLPLCHVILRG